MSMGGCLLLLRFSMKSVSILDRGSFSPATCVSTPVVKLVVVGGERNPGSLVPFYWVHVTSVVVPLSFSLLRSFSLSLSRSPSVSLP